MKTPHSTYGYYPGCSLERNAAAYDLSARAVANALGLTLKELEDWNCCGATEYIAISKLGAYALIARNLAIAQKQLAPASNGHGGARVADLIAPCSACFLNLRKTDRYMQIDPYLAHKTNEALAAGGFHYDGGAVRVRHLLDVMVNDVGYATIQARVTKPLTGLRVAAYYGCLIARPRFGGEVSNPEYPTELDTLIQALGAEGVDFPLKAHCCGGHMTQISAEVAYELIRRLLQNATDYNADVIVTLCPMCQLNLDAYQSRVNQHFDTKFHLPILYFTQLMGIAFGLDAKQLGFGKEIISAAAALARIGVQAPPPEDAPQSSAPKRPAKRSKQALPVPRLTDTAEEANP